MSPAAPRLSLDPEREEAELREYLGASYDRSKLEGHERLLDEEAARTGDEAAFYRSSEAYLYDLTAFAMTGTKLPYLQLLVDFVAPGARVLDYGCGIGSDGLLLLEAGYRVEFADFANPSTAYLRWRLEKRGLDAPVHDFDRGVPGGFDAVYAYDVIEHVPDPFVFLRELEARAGLVELNLLEHEPHEQFLHHELPISRLVVHAACRRLEAYRLVHGTSHLLLYRPQLASPAEAARNLAAVAIRRWPARGLLSSAARAGRRGLRGGRRATRW